MSELVMDKKKITLGSLGDLLKKYRKNKKTEEDKEEDYDISIETVDIKDMPIYQEILGNEQSRKFNQLFKSMGLINPVLNQYVSVERFEDKHYLTEVVMKLHGGLALSTFKNKSEDIAHNLNTRALRIESVDDSMVFKAYKKDVAPLKIKYGDERKYMLLHGIDEDGNNDYINLLNDYFIRVLGSPGCGKSTKLYTMLLDIIKYDKAIVDIICLKGKAPFEMFEGIPNIRSITTTPEEGYEVAKKFYEEGRARNDKYIDCNKLIEEGADLKIHILLIDECGGLTRKPDNKNEFNPYLDIMEKIPKELRSAGYKMVLATQRPTKTEISPTISAVMPAVIGMKASNQGESDIMVGEGERLQDYEPHTGLFRSYNGSRFVRNFKVTDTDVVEELEKIKRERGWV